MIYSSGQYAETGDRVKDEWGELGTVVEVRPLEIVIKWDKGVLHLEYPSGDPLTLVARSNVKTSEPPK
jgi:hypothetical protein